MQKMGIDGYTESCREIVGAAKQIVLGIKKDFPELRVLGDPLVSVVAFDSRLDNIPIYEVGDLMSKKGWHCESMYRSCRSEALCSLLGAIRLLRMLTSRHPQ